MRGTDVYLMPMGPAENAVRTDGRAFCGLTGKAGRGLCFLLLESGMRRRLGKLVRAVDAPLNILLQPGGSSVFGIGKAWSGASQHWIGDDARSAGDGAKIFQSAFGISRSFGIAGGCCAL